MIIAAIMMGSLAGTAAATLGYLAFGLTIGAAFTVYLFTALAPAAFAIMTATAQALSEGNTGLTLHSDV